MKAFDAWGVADCIRADRSIAQRGLASYFSSTNLSNQLISVIEGSDLSLEKKFLVAANALARMGTRRGTEVLSLYAQELLSETKAPAALAERALFYLSRFAHDKTAPRSDVVEGFRKRLSKERLSGHGPLLRPPSRVSTQAFLGAVNPKADVLVVS